MKKWRAFVLGAITTTFIGMSAGASAGNYDSCCNPCDWNICDQCFEIGADFIYWKPCVDDLDVAAILETDESDNRNIKYKSLCLDWEPGFRVYLNTSGPCSEWGLALSYTYLKSKDSAKQEFTDSDDDNGILSPLIFPADIFDEGSPFAFGDEKWDLRYQEWDVLFYYDLFCDRCHHFSPYFGVAGIYLEQELEGEFVQEAIIPVGLIAKQFDEEVINNVKWDSDYWGVGLRFGTAYNYEICGGVSLFANANGSLLVGTACSTKTQTVENTFFEEVDVIRHKDDDNCHFVPGYHISAGFDYEGSWCDCHIGARLGYEFVYWQNIPNHRVFSGENVGGDASFSTSPSTRDLGFHGLLAGVAVSF